MIWSLDLIHDHTRLKFDVEFALGVTTNATREHDAALVQENGELILLLGSQV